MRRGCKRCSEWENHVYWSHMDFTKISFYKKMDTSFSKKMDLPKDFHRNFKGRIGETVELKGPSGNVCQVSVIKSVEKFTFQSGWKDFVFANNIEANDILVFKYSGRSFFQVQIFDPNGCERTSSFFAKKEEVEAQEMSDSSIKIVDGADRNMHQDKITVSDSSSDSEYSTDSVPVRMPRGRACMEAGTSKDPLGGVEIKTPNNEPITFAQKLFPTPAQKKRAMQLSQGVRSGNHCFIVFMKSVTRNRKLSIPSKFVGEHLPKETRKATLHYMKDRWPLSLCSNRKHYLLISGGWVQFVRNNNLQEGDICLFELMKDQETVSFKVHISRK